MSWDEVNIVGLFTSAFLAGVTAGGVTQVVKTFLRVLVGAPLKSDDKYAEPKWVRLVVIALPVIIGSLLGLVIDMSMKLPLAWLAGMIGGTVATTAYKRAVKMFESMQLPGSN